MLWNNILTGFSLIFIIPVVWILFNYNKIEFDKYIINEGTTHFEHWEYGPGFIVLEGYRSTAVEHNEGVILSVFDSSNELIVNFILKLTQNVIGTKGNTN